MMGYSRLSRTTSAMTLPLMLQRVNVRYKMLLALQSARLAIRCRGAAPACRVFAKKGAGTKTRRQTGP